jgi:chromosome segregation protein
LRIKKLELVGFKSFKDRTVIQFDHGITGVVGPNGCGKSNIVDALVWVMGEMSAKHLRGADMQDVIFAGAEGYSPLGMAEVSLTLENDGGPFPAQYSRFSEVMVTRRLHRNGESEYLINKEPARLRDIQEIFMDTGAGSKGFSIIEQGAIGKIITAKPIDRRVLIEEAAGITKFKVRKRESQRKLVSTDQNLIRLQDILSEQKRQLDSLERQAQRADRFRKLRGELQDKDLWLSARHYGKLRDEAQTLEARAAQARDEEAQLSARLNAEELRLQELKTLLAEKSYALNRAQEVHQNLVSDVSEMEYRVRELTFAIEQGRKNEERAGSLLSQYELRRGHLLDELESANEKLSACRETVTELELELSGVTGQYESLSESVRRLDEQLLTERRELLSQTAALSHGRAQIEALQAKQVDRQAVVEGISQRVETLSRSKVEFTERRNQIFKELEAERQTHLELHRSVEATQAHLDQMRASKRDREEELSTLKDELNSVSSRLYGLENLQSNFEGFEQGVKSVMMWQKSTSAERFRPLAEVVEVPPQFEVAMEAALGQRLQTLLCDSSTESLSAVDYLKSSSGGRSSFTSVDVQGGAVHGPTETLETVEPVNWSTVASESGLAISGALLDLVEVPEVHRQQVAHFLKDIVIVDSIRTALQLRPRFPGRTFVTTDGDTLSQDGVLTGGSAEGADSGVLRRRREIKDLSARREELAGKVQLSRLMLEKLTQEVLAIETELETAKTSMVHKEILVAQLKKDLERAENELANSESAFHRENEAFTRENTALGEIGERLQAVQTDVADRQARLAALEQSVARLDADILQQRADLEGHTQTVTNLRVRAAERRQELEGLERQTSYLEQSRLDLESQLADMSKEAERNQNELSESQIRIEEIRSQLTLKIHAVQESERLVAQEKEAYAQQDLGLIDLDKSVFEARSRLNEVRTQAHTDQMQCDQLKLKEDQISIQVQERYSVNIGEHVPQFQPADGDPTLVEAAIEAEVLELREKVKKIGDVNLAAINEYDELKTRYEFLNQQYQDLIEAKDNLRKVIDRINRICSRRFKETFEQVNSRFQQVFPVLFGGGEAALVLVEDPEGEDDPGIDIIAKPPGKKLQNVSLLSGGEKALTAVSLIFSIFLVRPSPFCLLDEVDAPLDDANVMRFNELVKEMAKRSQIIVVTHNKHTMKVNNKLYGVTMQEKGVSKMVSVSLDDAARLAEA